MKLFFDTEFIEDPRYPIELISIGYRQRELNLNP